MEPIKWMYGSLHCIIRFKSLPIDDKFNSNIHLVRGADDAIQSQ
ncbi:unnamed protein product, partial [Rotaria magnacalcarata]